MVALLLWHYLPQMHAQNEDVMAEDQTNTDYQFENTTDAIFGLLAGITTTMEALVANEVFAANQMVRALQIMQVQFIEKNQPDSAALVELMIRPFVDPQREDARSLLWAGSHNKRRREMDDKTQDAVRAVVEYLYDDERRDFEGSGEPENHIFRHVRRLQRSFEIE